MDDIKYCFLTDEKDIIEYEKGLYNAFKNNDPTGWILNNYKMVDECRLISKTLDYDDQEFYTVKKDGIILIGAAVNYNIKKKLQLEEMGFKIDKNNNNFCEGLILYTINSENIDFLHAASNLFEFIKKRMLEKEIKKVYGTCSRKLKAMYSLLGYIVIDRLTLKDGTIKLLMSMDL